MSRAGVLTMVLLLTAGVASGAGSSHKKKGATASNKVGAFDYYVLTLSWSPEYCVTHQGAAECAAKKGFVLHGLWPENNNGSYPQACSHQAGPSDPSLYRDIYPDAGLLAHEWEKHGTCSGLGPDAYFAAEKTSSQAVTIPPALAQVTTPIQLTPQELLTDFAQANPSFPADSFVVSCGNNRLTAIEVCVGKDLKAIRCQGLRGCHANVVTVTPPGATSD